MDDNGTLKRAISHVCQRRGELEQIAAGRCPNCQATLDWADRGYSGVSLQWSCLCGEHGWLYRMPLLSVRFPQAWLVAGDVEAAQADLFALQQLASATGGSADATTAGRVLWQYMHAADLIAARKAIAALRASPRERRGSRMPHGGGSLLPHATPTADCCQGGTMYSPERKLRAVSDLHMDDTCGEMDLVEDAAALVATMHEAAADSTITLAEMAECTEAAPRLYSGSVDSLERNVAHESGLTRLAAELHALLVGMDAPAHRAAA